MNNHKQTTPVSPSLPLTPAASGEPKSSVSHTVNSPSAKQVLSPGEWVRQVSGLDAPFGFDRMPTVWG